MKRVAHQRAADKLRLLAGIRRGVNEALDSQARKVCLTGGPTALRSLAEYWEYLKTMGRLEWDAGQRPKPYEPPLARDS